MRAVVASLLVTLVSGFGPIPSAVAKLPDNFLHPKFAEQSVRSIGLLPLNYRKHDEEARRLMPVRLEMALAKTGYGFQGAQRFRSHVSRVGADSLYQTLDEQWKKRGELDAGTLRALGELVSVDAVLAPFLDKWERETIQYDVRGQSTTEITLVLALYSLETGELLWSAKIEEIGEGPYNDADEQQVVGLRGGGTIAPQARTSVALDPPTYEEVAARVQKKIRERFPSPPPVEEAASDDDGEGGG